MINLLSDLCGRLVHWHNRKIEISILSFILWVLVLIAAAVALFYLNASDLGVSSNACVIYPRLTSRSGVWPVFAFCMPFVLGRCEGRTFQGQTDIPVGAQVQRSNMLLIPQGYRYRPVRILGRIA